MLTRSLWRNWLARSTVNRKDGGSSPPRDETIYCSPDTLGTWNSSGPWAKPPLMKELLNGQKPLLDGQKASSSHSATSLFSQLASLFLNDSLKKTIKMCPNAFNNYIDGTFIRRNVKKKKTLRTHLKKVSVAQLVSAFDC